MKPSVGRIVHYVSFGTPGGEYGKECRAAVITEIQDDPRTSVGLCVLNPAGHLFDRAVPLHSGDGEGSPGTNLCGGLDFQGGTWHWPEREPSGDAPKVEVSADLSPQQVKQITGMIQASLLQQAKRGRR